MRASMGAMNQNGDPLQWMKLRAFDLSDRTLRRSRASAIRRVDRWRQRSFMIGQCAVTAGVAWFLAGLIPGHQVPFLAPVASIVTLGITFGQRLRRGVEIAIGVAVGVAVADIWIALFHTGVWQIVVVCALSMSIATLLGAGPLMTTQAAVNSIVVTAIAPPGVGFGVSRWLDAVIGCALALLVATIAPSSPLRKPGEVAAQVLTEMAETLDAAVAAVHADDAETASEVLDRARAGEVSLAALEEAAAEGVAVVRHSPFRRGQLSAVEALADLTEPLDHASRNLRVLARRCAIAIWRGQEVPAEYLDLIERLAEICRFMARELEAHRLPTQARERLQALGQDSAQVRLDESISAVVILAQTRSMVADLLELTGMSYAEARELIPDID
jgi:uncharacterized membrane protein YgaE (UPF0421/DUF939 family)